MATFKVGQRVKRVSCGITIPIGAVGTVEGDDGGKYVAVKWDGYQREPSWGYNGVGAWYRSSLAPLTPPASDAWAAEKVKQLTKPTYTEPVIEKETA